MFPFLENIKTTRPHIPAQTRRCVVFCFCFYYSLYFFSFQAFSPNDFEEKVKYRKNIQACIKK